MSVFSAVIFGTFFAVHSQLRTTGHSLKIMSDTEETWMFGYSFSQRRLLVDGTNWNKEQVSI